MMPRRTLGSFLAEPYTGSSSVSSLLLQVSERVQQHNNNRYLRNTIGQLRGLQ